MRRVWLRVALAAGAGLGSLVVCSGAMVAIVLLIIASLDFGAAGPLSSHPVLFWLGVVTVVVFAGASLSLPALALGARGGHVTKTTLLSGLGLCAFVFFVFVSFENVTAVPFALMALVATSVIGSLIAIHQEEGHITVPLGRATLIAAVAVYCASLLAWWLVPVEEGWLYSLVPVFVASSSWLVVPAIVAALRPG